MRKIKLTKSFVAESSNDYSKWHVMHLTFRGDKVSGLTAQNVAELLKAKDIPLYVLSRPNTGAPEMLRVISSNVADAQRNANYDPDDWGTGNILVAEKEIAPYGINWLTVDDNDRVYINISDLGNALKALGI